ncbi:MAG: hypothetical protein Q8P15_02460 [Nanoarchaeota archaeon]|nr:hypothetical protein [Nanoarchaeota archaeon]
MMGRNFDPQSLKEYMDSKPFKVFNKKSFFPIQKSFFEECGEAINYGYRKTIGDFYEILSYAIFGGKWQGNSDNSENENGNAFKPDIINSDKKIIIESKAVCWRESCKFTDYQMGRYLLQQCDSFFMKHHKIFFSIYKYKLREPLNYFKEFKEDVLENIVRTLSENTGYSLFFPFSVAHAIHNPKTNGIYKSRYERKRWDPITRLTATGIKKMFLDPEEFLEKIGLSPERYNITRTKTPKGMKMNQYEIPEFPILYIEDKNYKKWFEVFKTKYSEEASTIRIEEKTKEDYREMRKEGCSDEFTEEEIRNAELAKTTKEIPF